MWLMWKREERKGRLPLRYEVVLLTKQQKGSVARYRYPPFIPTLKIL